MDITNATHQQIYAIRLKPLLQSICKKKKWQLKKESFQKLLNLLVEKLLEIKLDDFIALTDDSLLYQIYQLFEIEPLSEYLASIDLVEIKRSEFDIRHKEALRLCIKDYFQLFLADLAYKMDFSTIRFLDKELTALFGGERRITDALILVDVHIDNETRTILIHWEQQSNRKSFFEEGMFHSFCGLYFQYRKLIFPIAMFTDQARWEKPVSDTFKLELLDFPINEYHYHLIKLKSYDSETFEALAQKNPLAYAYLPLTNYDKKDRPRIKAKAMNGILANFSNGQKQATLISLVDESIQLDSNELKTYNQLINENSKQLKEVKMFQSLEEYLLYKGKKEGKKEGKEEGKEEAQREILTRLIELEILSDNQLTQMIPLFALVDTSELVKTVKPKKGITAKQQFALMDFYSYNRGIIAALL